MPHAHILIVDDEPGIREWVGEILRDEGYDVAVAEDAPAAREAVRRQRPDLVLLDVWLPGEDGLSLLREWGHGAEGLPFAVVMMSGHGTIETAVEATRLGAWDFVEKPVSLAKLLLAVERGLEAHRLRRTVAELRRGLPDLQPVGQSPAMIGLRGQLERLAALNTPLLLRGEAGTGKETLARYLHERGARAGGPFVAFDPAAAGREQIAPLFGREGEDGSVQFGLIEQAAGGMLYIEELAALEAEVQLRLAGALERGAVLRLGGVTPLRLDARLVVATAHDPDALLSSGRLRPELYYQINVVSLLVPPLRERAEDLPALYRHFAEFFARRDGLPVRALSPEAAERLKRHPFPGNLRELRLVVQRLLLSGSGTVDAAALERAIGPAPTGEPAAGGREATIAAPMFAKPLREAREDFERLYLEHHLARAGGSVARLAKMVGMERTHLYRKLRDLGIELRSERED
jgi:DNA-binding NtrC family response regulator